MTRESLTIAVLCLLAIQMFIETALAREKRAMREIASHQWRDVERSISLLRDSYSIQVQSTEEGLVVPDEVVQENLRTICRTLVISLDVTAASVSCIDARGLQWVASYGPGTVEHEGLTSGGIVPPEDSYCQFVVATGEPLVVEDSLRHEVTREMDRQIIEGTRSYLGAPIRRIDGTTTGALCVFSAKPRRWTDRDVAVVSSFASLFTL